MKYYSLLSLVLISFVTGCLSFDTGGEIKTGNHNAVTSQGNDYGTDTETTTKININTASSKRLQTLKGIGPSSAQAIIYYRTENRFDTTKKIKKVDGIGPMKFHNIKDQITVE
ncbi:MAG: ComEA family DNA-binding protein [bacterium]